MTISSQNRQAGPYLGNGVATAFTFAFKVFAVSDLQVVCTDAAGIESTLWRITDYTVTLNSNQDSNPGGTVTLLGGALAGGAKLTITSDIVPLQTADLTNQGGFYPKVITNALDKLTILIQQLFNSVGRQITVPISDGGGVNVSLPSARNRANTVLGFDALGGVTTYSAASAVTDTANVNFLPSGTGALPRTALDKLREIVSIWDYIPVGTNTAAVDCSAYIHAALNTGKAVYFPAGTYLCNIVLNSAFCLFGDGLNKTTLQPYTTSLPLVKNLYITGAWNFSTIRDINLESSGRTGVGFSFGDPAGYTANQEFIGRVIFDRVRFAGFDKGVIKCCGNIGNTYRDCQWAGNAYGWYAQDSARVGGGVMHACADRFYGCHFDGHTRSAVHVLDHTIGTGQLVFNGTLFEGNSGFAVFMDMGGIVGPGYIFDGVWFEANAAGGAATVDAYTGSYTGMPKDVYLNGARNVILRQTTLGNLQLVNSHLVTDYCDTFLGAGPGFFSIVKDSRSSVAHRGVSTDYFNDTSLVFPPFAGHKQVGTNTPKFSTVPGAIPVAGAGNGSILNASAMTSARAITGSATTRTGTVVKDGMSFARCNEYVFPANGGYNILGLFNVTVGKWYVVTVQVRKVWGGTAQLAFTYGTSLSGTVAIDHVDWRQYTLVVTPSTTNTSGILLYSDTTDTTFRVGHFQAVEFDTQEQAANYAYSGRLAMGDETAQPQSAAYPFNGQATSPATVDFNSGNFSVNLTNSSYQELFRCYFGGLPNQVVVDMLDAFVENYNGGSVAQNAGFRTLTFSSLAATVTSTFSGCTVTFRWTNVSGSAYKLEAQITTGPASLLAVTGIAFVKGK